MKPITYLGLLVIAGAISPPASAAPLELLQSVPMGRSTLQKSEPEVLSSAAFIINADGLSRSTRSISLRLGNRTVVAKRIGSYRDNQGFLVWKGLIGKGREAESNTVVLVKTDKSVMATVHLNGKLHKLTPTGKWQAVMQEIDPAAVTPDHSKPLSLSKTPKHYSNSLMTRALEVDGSPKVIRVLVGYTPEAEEANSDIDALISLAIAETNLGYANSGLNAKVELAYSYELDYNESGDHGTDLDRFEDPDDGRMDEVHDLRDRYGADVAAILIDDAGSCGRAAAIGADDDEAFFVVKDSCATGNYSFGHELGHLLSARHNPERDDKLTPIAYAHGYLNEEGGWRSIMSYNSNSCCTRQNFWSDPDRLFEGEPRGSASLSDNARALAQTIPVIARFRDGFIGGDDFNSGLSFWRQSSSSDDWDWTRQTGSTPSGSTGPDGDADDQGAYMYFETSNNQGAYESGQTAYLKSPDIQADDLRLEFDYHMYGSDIGSLSVDVYYNGSWTRDIWQKEGQRHSSDSRNYSHASVDLSDYDDEVQIRIRAESAGGWRGDIAIDNLFLFGKTTGARKLESVDFEDGLDGWTQGTGDSHDWTLNSDGTPSSSTGPASGALTSGNYVYLETSSSGANSDGDDAYLVSPDIGGYNRTLTFYYHMYGEETGELRVDIFEDSSWQRGVWSVAGQQHHAHDDPYNRAIVDLSGFSGDIKVRFKAEAVGGWKGDIALDDIRIDGYR